MSANTIYSGSVTIIYVNCANAVLQVLRDVHFPTTGKVAGTREDWARSPSKVTPSCTRACVARPMARTSSSWRTGHTFLLTLFITEHSHCGLHPSEDMTYPSAIFSH